MNDRGISETLLGINYKGLLGCSKKEDTTMKENISLHKLPPPPRQSVSSSSTYNLDGSRRNKLLKRSPQEESGDGCFYQFQVDVIGILIKNCPDNYEFWCARRIFAGLEINNATTKSCELQLTEEILLMFPRNKLAWSYRQWVYEKNGGAQNDLSFYDKLLQDDSSNKFAWNQRLFLVPKFKREAVGAAEAELAIRAILDEPENEYPWIYLRSLYNSKVVTTIDNIKLDGLFTSVIAFDAAAHLQPPDTPLKLNRRECARDLEVNAVMNRKVLVNALETLICLRSCSDYTIRSPVYDAVRSVHLDDGGMCVPESIYSTLQFVDPLRAPYWKRHIDYLNEFRRYNR